MAEKQTTTSEQFIRLVNFMKEHEQLAKGLLNTPQFRNKKNELWEEITGLLNARGRLADGWKKVRKDYKYHIKNKIRHNTRCIKGTGGGPNKQQVLSVLKEEVVVLLDLKTLIKGLNVAEFGVSSRSSAVPSSTSTSTAKPTDEMGAVFDQNEPTPVTDDKLEDFSCIDDLVSQNESERRPVTPPRKNRVPQRTAKKLLEIQVNQQNDYFKESTKLQKESNKLVAKLTEEIKQIRRLKQDELKLIKRQLDLQEKENIENSKFKIAELEIKKRKLELKEEEIQNNNNNF